MTPPTPARRRKLSATDSKLGEGLANLGLTDYETRVYLAILRHPRSRVPEIARWSEVPQPKVYATLKRLIERGLCESILGPINRYTALPPAEAFRPLLEDMKARESDAQKAIASLHTEHRESNRSLSRREGRIKLFQGKHAAGRNFKFLFDHAEEDVQVVIRLPLVVSDDESIVRERIERGVRIRYLAELPDGVTPELEEILEQHTKIGVEIRQLPQVPMRMAIFDQKITTLPMIDPQPGEGDGFIMLEVRNQSLSAGFVGMFEMMWSAAKKV